MRPSTLAATMAAGMLICAGQLGAQGFYLGLRGGGAVPTGAFNGDESFPDCIGCNGVATALVAAKTGFGYGLDAGLQFGLAGIYAGFDHINFDCQSGTCNSDGKYKLQGASAGIKLQPPGLGFARPWAKGGVTFNELEGGYGAGTGNDLKTNRAPGYEIGVGLDIDILGLFSITPQARYVGQNFKYKVPGLNTAAAVPTQGVNYYSLDLGLSLHNPLGRMKR